MLLAFLAVPAVAAAAEPSFVIQGDHKIGSYAVQRDGSFRGLIAAFGRPSSVKGSQRSGSCRAAWNAIGLRVDLYNLAGANPCTPTGGRFAAAMMTGPRWRTALGLRIGDPLGKLRRLYPRAERERGSWSLVIRFTQATGRYPGLSAKVRSGRVSAFSVIYQAGGE